MHLGQKRPYVDILRLISRLPWASEGRESTGRVGEVAAALRDHAGEKGQSTVGDEM